jgi:translation elongation factor EF-1beta
MVENQDYDFSSVKQNNLETKPFDIENHRDEIIDMVVFDDVMCNQIASISRDVANEEFGDDIVRYKDDDWQRIYDSVEYLEDKASCIDDIEDTLQKVENIDFSQLEKLSNLDAYELQCLADKVSDVDVNELEDNVSSLSSNVEDNKTEIVILQARVEKLEANLEFMRPVVEYFTKTGIQPSAAKNPAQ